MGIFPSEINSSLFQVNPGKQSTNISVRDETVTSQKQLRSAMNAVVKAQLRF